MIWTDEHAANLKSYLETHTLPSGVGDRESACSIAAINLAIDGKLTDDIPDCMCEVLGSTIISLQDAIPDDMRNSARYRAMLQRAPGTGRDKEEERLEVLMGWMRGTVSPEVQRYADENGFGDEWRKMCKERTSASAHAASTAAPTAANAAAYAAYAAAAYAYASYSKGDFWQTVDPIGVLERMIEV